MKNFFNKSGERLLGVYEFGYENIEVYAVDDIGGSFSLSSANIKMPNIKVGIDYAPGDFHVIVSVFIHEIFELLLARKGCRFEDSTSLNRGHDKYVFLFNHPVFTEVCTCASESLFCVLNELKKVGDEYNKWKKKNETK